MASKKTRSAAPVSTPVETVRWRDTRYRSRTLVLPAGRTLAVTAATVQVPSDDAEALAWLDQHAEFQRHQE